MEIIVPTFQDLYEDSTRKPALSPPACPAGNIDNGAVLIQLPRVSESGISEPPGPGAEPVPLGAQAQCSVSAGWDAGGAWIPRADRPDHLTR